MRRARRRAAAGAASRPAPGRRLLLRRPRATRWPRSAAGAGRRPQPCRPKTCRPPIACTASCPDTPRRKKRENREKRSDTKYHPDTDYAIRDEGAQGICYGETVKVAPTCNFSRSRRAVLDESKLPQKRKTRKIFPAQVILPMRIRARDYDDDDQREPLLSSMRHSHMMNPILVVRPPCCWVVVVILPESTTSCPEGTSRSRDQQSRSRQGRK